MATRRPVLVTGGTGLVGGRLLPRLESRGGEVRVLTRDPSRMEATEGRRPVGWDGVTVPADAVRGTDAVIHLAGEPVFQPHPGSALRERIRASRVDTTRSLVGAIASVPEDQRPRTLLCASAIGYYGGDRGEEKLDEDAAPGEGFLAELCRDWEAEAARAEAEGVRPVSIRIGVVLAREGGALEMMARLFRLGLGGRLGSGRQWFSWIQADDLARLLLFALDEERLRGPLNAVAPRPVRNAELTAALAERLHRPALIPVPAFALRVGLGEIADELLGSRRLVPARALELGFDFEHERIESALDAELG